MTCTIAESELVSELVSRLDFLQAEFPLMGRLDGPAVAPPQLVAMCKTYRQAVRVCWALRRVKRMTHHQLAAEIGAYPQHISDYLAADDAPRRRNLPAESEAVFQAVCGNTLLAQWHALQVRLTVLEEMQAQRRVA